MYSLKLLLLRALRRAATLFLTEFLSNIVEWDWAWYSREDLDFVHKLSVAMIFWICNANCHQRVRKVMRSQQHMILPFTRPARCWYGTCTSTSCYKIGIDFKFDENLQAEGYLLVEVSIKVMTGLVIFLAEDNALSWVFQLCTQSCTTRTVDQILQEGDRRCT